MKAKCISHPLASHHAIATVGAFSLQGSDQSLGIQRKGTGANTWLRIGLAGALFGAIADPETIGIEELKEHQQNRLNAQIAAPEPVLGDKLQQKNDQDGPDGQREIFLNNDKLKDSRIPGGQ